MKSIQKALLILFAMVNGSMIYAQSAEKRNFVIIIADDAAWNDFEAYGNKSIRTPNIDRLANEGLKFTNAFLTTSSCSPSRCSIMTGRYPHNTGAPNLGMPLPPDQIIFPGELKKAGYYTVSAGKWHLGPPRMEFDTIYGGGGPSGCGFWEKALQNRPKERPFFMWLAAIDPHRPYEPNIIPDPHKPSDVIVPSYLPDNDSTRKDLALYYDEVNRLDSYVGKVMTLLKKQGVDRNTVVIFMSDNGMPFPRAKNRLYDSGIKMPFIIRWPDRIKPGTESSSIISSIDIAPTICEMAGLEIPEPVQGVSFAPILSNQSKITRDEIFSEHNFHDYQAHERAVRTNRFLYIRNAFPELNASPPADVVRGITYQEMIRIYKKGMLKENETDCFIKLRPSEELYDVNKDPEQLNNLAIKNNYSDVLQKMRRKLDQWIAETKDVIPANPKPDGADRMTGISLRKL